LLSRYWLFRINIWAVLYLFFRQLDRADPFPSFGLSENRRRDKCFFPGSQVPVSTTRYKVSEYPASVIKQEAIDATNITVGCLIVMIRQAFYAKKHLEFLLSEEPRLSFVFPIPNVDTTVSGTVTGCEAVLRIHLCLKNPYLWIIECEDKLKLAHQIGVLLDGDKYGKW
jgi:hypothetical protein